MADSHQGIYLDFWTLAEFWRQYFPLQPRPREFLQSGVRDFQVLLTGDAKSGLVMRDLVIPVFNGASEIAGLLARSLQIDIASTAKWIRPISDPVHSGGA